MKWKKDHQAHTALTWTSRVTGVAAVVAATALVAGCSSGTGTSTQSSADSQEFAGQTLEVAAAWSGTEQENFEKVLQVFEDETGATVNYSSYGDNMATTLGTKISGGGAPNVAIVSSPALLKQLAAAGNLKPLSDDAKSAVEENYSQDWQDLASYDGELYGVWFKASNKSTMWYNTDTYDEAGASVPTTWDDFLTQLQTLSDAGYYGISIGADSGWPITDWFENVYLRTAGADKYDQLTNHEIPWTDESVTEALQVMGDLFGNSSLVEPGGDQRTWNETVTEVFGDSPKAGTLYEGDFVASEISASTSSTVGENANFYSFPSINDSPDSVVGGGDVAVSLSDTAATQALMEFLASPEAANIWIPLGGFTSPNLNADTSLYPDDVSRSLAEALTGAEVFRFDMSDLAPSAFGSTKGSGEWQALIDFYKNPTDISGAQQKLEEAASAATGWGE